jgi:iron complex transport system permease protein
MRISKRDIKLIVLLLLPAVAVFLSLFIGTYPVPPGAIFSILWSKLTGSPIAYPTVYEKVILEIRMPRIILGLLGGIALSVSGASLQGIFRNPLVDSYILGVSAGAGLGAALGIAYLPDVVGMTQLLAFLFGFGAFLLTYYAARTRGETPVISLVLGGIIVTALLSAGQTIVKFLTSPEQLAGIVYWLMGSLASANWSDVLIILPFTLTSFAVILLMRWRLNVLSMGDEEAKSLGVNVERDRGIVLVATTLMVSAFVSVAGIIGWIGLIIPPIVRMFMKTSDNRVVIPVSAALGALTLIIADDVARSLLSFELPVGILTTLIGAPFFLYLLKRRSA